MREWEGCETLIEEVLFSGWFAPTWSCFNSSLLVFSCSCFVYFDSLKSTGWQHRAAVSPSEPEPRRRIFGDLSLADDLVTVPFPGAGIDRHSFPTAPLRLKILMEAHFRWSWGRPCVRIEFSHLHLIILSYSRCFVVDSDELVIRWPRWWRLKPLLFGLICLSVSLSHTTSNNKKALEVCTTLPCRFSWRSFPTGYQMHQFSLTAWRPSLSPARPLYDTSHSMCWRTRRSVTASSQRVWEQMRWWRADGRRHLIWWWKRWTLVALVEIRSAGIQVNTPVFLVHSKYKRVIFLIGRRWTSVHHFHPLCIWFIYFNVIF